MDSDVIVQVSVASPVCLTLDLPGMGLVLLGYHHFTCLGSDFQVLSMGCNVSKDGKEKTDRNKKTKTDRSGRNSAKENGQDNAGVNGTDNINAHTQEKNLPEGIDIDCDDPEVEEAATKIQAAFRGSQARKNLKTNTMQESRQSEVPVEEELDPNDPEVNQAAAKIQASFRGHMVRKEMTKKKQDDDYETAAKAAQSTQKNAEEEEIDIDLNDPNVEKAATKIQASFRGHLVRKQINTDDTA